MDYLNTTSNKLETSKNLSISRNMTLDKFKQRLLDTHQKAISPKNNLSILPKISLTSPPNYSKSSSNKIQEYNTSFSNGVFSTSSNQLTKYLHHSITNLPNYPIIDTKEELFYDESKEKDINPLISYYHFTSTEKFSNKNFERYKSNISKMELFQKYHLKNKLDENVKSITLSKDENQSSDNKFNNIKAKFVVHDEYFKNPLVSRSKIDMNKQIYENIMNITLHKQAKIYGDRIKKENEKEKKIQNMPDIRTSVIDSSNMKKDKSSFIEKYEKAKVSRNLYINKSISRDQIFTIGVELKCVVLDKVRNKPKARCQASVTLYENKIFLFGGINNISLGDLWVNDINDYYSWNTIYTKEEPLARYGHTSVLYKKEIYIFGGVTDNSNYVREDIVIYDIEKKKFKLEEKTSNKLYFKWRRNHTAEIVGHHMVVYGGIDDDENVLDDLWILDLNFTLRWNMLDIRGPRHKALAHHCSALILPFEKRNNPQMSIYKFPDIPTGRTTFKGSKIEAIAYFGGIDNEGNINDELRLLKIGKKNLEWVVPLVKGDIPEGKKNASLTFYESLNVLILFGGENVRQEFSNDLHFLDLELFKWIRITLYESIPLERSSHCCILYQNQLIIFGGLNAEKYVGSNMSIINLDIYDKKTKHFSNKKVYVSKDDIDKKY